MIQLHGSPGCETACHSAMTAVSAPAMGVHKPANRSMPAPVVATCSVADPSGGPPRSAAIPWTINTIPATSLINRRPAPGNPWANVEKSRLN